MRARQLSRRSVLSGSSAAPFIDQRHAPGAADPAGTLSTRRLAIEAEQRCLQLKWPLVVSQCWRWRHPRLWPGRTFDPHNPQQVMSYAVLRLRRDTRDVFLLNSVMALDYAVIARHLGLSVAEVQAHLAAALYEISRTIDLIERVRPPSKRSKAEHPHV